MTERRIFTAYQKGRPLLVVDILLIVLWFLITFILASTLLINATVLQPVITAALTYIIYHKLVRNCIVILDNKDYGVLKCFLGTTHGKIQAMPPLSHIYIYRTNGSLVSSGQKYGMDKKVGMGAIVLQLFDTKDQEVFHITSTNEDHIDQNAISLSNLLDLEIHDYRGREMEIYKANNSTR